MASTFFLTICHTIKFVASLSTTSQFSHQTDILLFTD